MTREGAGRQGCQSQIVGASFEFPPGGPALPGLYIDPAAVACFLKCALRCDAVARSSRVVLVEALSGVHTR